MGNESSGLSQSRGESGTKISPSPQMTVRQEDAQDLVDSLAGLALASPAQRWALQNSFQDIFEPRKVGMSDKHSEEIDLHSFGRYYLKFLVQSARDSL